MKKHRLLAAVMSGIMMLSCTPVVSEALAITASAEGKLAAPENFQAVSKTETSVKLKWSKVSGASAYRVYLYNSSKEEYEAYKSVKENYCNVTGLESGTTYKFKVAALVKSGSSYKVQTISSKLSVKTDKEDLLEAPKNIKATTAETSIKLSWDEVELADAYRVYKYNSSTGKYESYKSISGTSCTVKNLSGGTKYKFKIVALVKNGSKYKEQTYSGAVSVSTKASAMRTTPGKFETPDFGAKSSTVLKNCGIANYTLTSMSTSSEKVYMGTVLYGGIKSDIILRFNSKDQLFYYALFVPMNYSDYMTVLSSFKDGLGNNYTLDYSDDYDLQYFWITNGGGLMVQYVSNNKQLLISMISTKYSP